MVLNYLIVSSSIGHYFLRPGFDTELCHVHVVSRLTCSHHLGHEDVVKTKVHLKTSRDITLKNIKKTRNVLYIQSGAHFLLQRTGPSRLPAGGHWTRRTVEYLPSNRGQK
jgi:hypothetical protein